MWRSAIGTTACPLDRAADKELRSSMAKELENAENVASTALGSKSSLPVTIV